MATGWFKIVFLSFIIFIFRYPSTWDDIEWWIPSEGDLGPSVIVLLGCCGAECKVCGCGDSYVCSSLLVVGISKCGRVSRLMFTSFGLFLGFLCSFWATRDHVGTSNVAIILQWPKIALLIEFPNHLLGMALMLPQRLACRRPCRFTSTSAATCFSALRFAPFGTLSQEILERWQRRSNRLEGLLKRVKCPKVETFEANGQVYQLPLPATVQKQEPSQEELEYLCGNFDGDGCVSMKKANGEIRLIVTQAIERAEILVRFREALGGCVYREKEATAFHSACLRWQAGGRAAQQAASVLSRVPSMKQAQLQIAADTSGGMVPADDRKHVADSLALLKAPSYSPLQGTPKCTWPYLAGFFDAEGSITIRSLHCSIYLAISQVNPFVLHQLLFFLQREGFEHWNLYHDKRGASRLSCTHFADAKSFLGQLLSNRLELKRLQAEATVTLTPENHSNIRDFVSMLNGLQGFYQRLDESGIEKSKEIQRQQTKIRRLRNQGYTEDCNTALLELAAAELQKLKEERVLCKAMSRCDKLRRQARKLLGQGATLMPI